MVRRGIGRAVLALVLALVLAPGAGRADAQTFAVSVNRVFNDHFDDAAYIDAQLDEVRDSGLRAVRSDAFWEWAEASHVEGEPHVYDWRMTDRVATALAEHGLRWLPILDYSAPWAASVPGETHSPPRVNDDFASYAGAFAARYGRGGSFWAEHPELDPLPTLSYEVWNEPNLAWFWQPQPDAARYADLYLRSRAAIKDADPEAVVVVGGLVPDTGYVEALYAARPELRGQVDALGWHPYAPTAAGAIGHVKALRQTLERLGDPAVPIYVTEVGWPTSGQGSPIVLPEPQRAAELEAVTETLARSDCGVEAIVPYTWVTPRGNPDDVEDWYGLGTESRAAYERVRARWAADPPTAASRLHICHPDADGDGVGDAEDGDDDNDGVADADDAFPLDQRESADRDGDGSGDGADLDDDGDAAPDAADAFPLDAAERADIDADGIGDVADPDDDGDGLPDAAELERGSSPADVDSDDDGLPDAREIRTSPTRADSDGDRLPDGVEAGIAAPVAPPAPLVAGTDWARFRPDRDPRTRTSTVRRDTDRDGLRDDREDRNRDGRRGRRETDPRLRDSDRDGVGDRRDRRPLDRRRA